MQSRSFTFYIKNWAEVQSKFPKQSWFSADVPFLSLILLSSRPFTRDSGLNSMFPSFNTAATTAKTDSASWSIKPTICMAFWGEKKKSNYFFPVVLFCSVLFFFFFKWIILQIYFWGKNPIKDKAISSSVVSNCDSRDPGGPLVLWRGLGGHVKRKTEETGGWEQSLGCPPPLQPQQLSLYICFFLHWGFATSNKTNLHNSIQRKAPHSFYISEKLWFAKVKCPAQDTVGNRRHLFIHKFLWSANYVPSKVVLKSVLDSRFKQNHVQGSTDYCFHMKMFI